MTKNDGTPLPKRIGRKIKQEIFVNLLRYDTRNWLRVRQIEAFTDRLKDVRGPVLEISPASYSPWSHQTGNYKSVSYPEFDICKDKLPEKFAAVIADQVLEHVADPAAAVTNIRAMLQDGGMAFVATPFLFRVHARPHDYTRWTEAGLRRLLVAGGFRDEDIESGAWGNKACARAHIGGPVRAYGWGRDMSNDPEYPMMVWAFARSPEARPHAGPAA